MGNANYRWWFAADTFGVLRGVSRYLAVSLVAFALTGSETLTALIGTATSVAALLGALPGGAVTDACRRTKLMKIGGLTGFAVNGLLALLLMLGVLPYWVLLVGVTSTALLAGMFGSASDAALKSIVESEDYASAMAANQGRDSALMLASSPLSGILYTLGSSVPFAFSSLCGLAEAACASKIHESYTPPETNETSFIDRVREGFTWIWKRRELRLLLVVHGVVTAGMVTAETAAELFLIAEGLSPVKIGLLGAVEGGAMLAGSALAGAVVRRFSTGLLAIAGLSWMAVWCVPMMVSQDFLVVLASLGMMSLSIPLYGATVDGYFYSQIPHELQGRAYSVAYVVQLGLSAGAPLFAAGLLTWAGLPAAALAGLTLLALATVLITFNKDVRSIPKPDQWPDADVLASERQKGGENDA